MIEFLKSIIQKDIFNLIVIVVIFDSIFRNLKGNQRKKVKLMYWN